MSWVVDRTASRYLCHHCGAIPLVQVLLVVELIIVGEVVMSRATKRKHVTKEVLEELVEPEGDQFVVKVRIKR